MLARVLGAVLLGGAAYFALSRSAFGATVTSAPEPSSPGNGPRGSEYLPLVRQIVAEEGQGIVTAADVMAVMEIESAFNPRAYRAEPKLGDGSRGLMQVLLMVARDRGYYGDPDGLYDPETNIRVGVAHLVWGYLYLDNKIAGAGVPEPKWVSAYNGGVGRVMGGWENIGYVSRFRSARDRWRRAGA